MTSSAAGSIDRRDAAVAAALAGTVVVVLGYASGVGISTSGDAVALQAPPPVAPAATPEHGTATTAQPQPVAQVPVLTAPPPSRLSEQPHHPVAVAHDHTPVTPTPPPLPDPPPITATCRPDLLDGLPVAGPLVGATSSLLISVLSAVPVVEELHDLSEPGSDLDPLACTLGELLAPTCCEPGTSDGAHTRTGARP